MTGTEIGILILQARQARGLSQEQVEDLTGIAQATQSKYESGKTKPSKNTLLRYSSAYGGAPELLLAACRFCPVAGALREYFRMAPTTDLQIDQLHATTCSLLAELSALKGQAPPADSLEYLQYQSQVREIMKKISIVSSAHAATFGLNSDAS